MFLKSGLYFKLEAKVKVFKISLILKTLTSNFDPFLKKNFLSILFFKLQKN